MNENLSARILDDLNKGLLVQLVGNFPPEEIESNLREAGQIVRTCVVTNNMSVFEAAGAIAHLIGSSNEQLIVTTEGIDEKFLSRVVSALITAEKTNLIVLTEKPFETRSHFINSRISTHFREKI